MRPGRGPGLRARGAAHSQRSSSKETTRSRSERERDAPSSEAVDELVLGVVAHVHRRDVVLDEAARLGRRVDVARRHALVVRGDVAQRRVGRADARPAVPLPVVAVVVGLLVRQHCRGSGSNVSPSPFRSERVRGRERGRTDTLARSLAVHLLRLAAHRAPGDVVAGERDVHVGQELGDAAQELEHLVGPLVGALHRAVSLEVLAVPLDLDRERLVLRASETAVSCAPKACVGEERSEDAR